MSAESDSTAAPPNLPAAVAQVLAEQTVPGQRLCLALSGGRDSVVLLHCLHRIAAPGQLRAIHVDHGLQAASGKWAEACQAICAELGVPLQISRVEVRRDTGLGLEAAAREARYAALGARVLPDEVLVTAHHRDDQVETLLLQLLRGAGMRGIAAMPVRNVSNGMTIIRPLLAVPARAIREYASAQGLQWVEDPSNSDLQLDRNFLRHEILPRLEQRWAAAAQSIARTARLSGEAAALLDELADTDLATLQSGNRIDLAGLRCLSDARQRNALRRALRGLELPIPSDKQLQLLLATMRDARGDSQPLVAWPGVRIHRYRDTLWLYAEADDPAARKNWPSSYCWMPQGLLDMGAVRGKLAAVEATGAGFRKLPANTTLSVRFRQGGEVLRPFTAAPSRDLKNLLQENHIVPWMRWHIPLIYSGDCLLAVGDLWVNAEYAAGSHETGLRIVWSEHAPLY